MQKQLLLILILFATMQVSAQISKNDFILSFSGNYQKSNDDIGVTTNTISAQSKQLSMGASLEYFISDRTSIGFGLEYQKIDESRFNQLLLTDRIQAEGLEIDSKIFLPNLRIAHYFPIVNKLYMSSLFRLGYGQMKSDFTSASFNNGYSEGGAVLEPSDNGPFYGVSEGDSEDNYFLADLTPELNYFFSNGFGLSLGLGGIHYAKVNGDSENSQWLVSFNPSYWTFGFKMKL